MADGSRASSTPRVAGFDPIAVDIDAKHRITFKHSRNEVFNPIDIRKNKRPVRLCHDRRRPLALKLAAQALNLALQLDDASGVIIHWGHPSPLARTCPPTRSASP